MSLSVSRGVFALVGAAWLAGLGGCLIYNEDLLLPGDEGGGGGGAGGGAMGGGGGTGGCSGGCGHLLISEVVVTPTRAELVELFNPLEESIALDNVWLADFPEYHTVTGGAPAVGGTDFLVRFPPGSTLAAGERLVVAIDSATEFMVAYGQPPDFDIASMPGTATAGTSGLANGDEMVVLFQWDGASPLVQDLDYLIWGDSSDAIDKTGVSFAGKSYLADTPAAAQSILTTPPSGMSLHRCNNDEPGEVHGGGNGVDGDDETSENLQAAFATAASSPKASPPAGACP